MKDADVQNLQQPKANQPIDYYQSYMQHLSPMIGLFEVRIGYLRWLQGTALEEVISSRKVKHGQYGRLLKLLELSKSTAYNCRVIARQVPAVNARRLGYTEMLRMTGLLNDEIEDFEVVEDDESDFDLTLADEDDFDEGEKPLPNITFHNFVPKLESIRDTLGAMVGMDYASEASEDAVKHYLEAKQHISKIKKHCLRVEKMLTKRIGNSRKVRKTKTA